MKTGIVFVIFAAICGYAAVRWQGPAWGLLWGAVAFALVGLGYLLLGPAVFGKRSDGSMALGSVVLLFPFLLCVWGVWFLLRVFRREAAVSRLTPDLLIGRRLFAWEYPPGIESILDLTCEFPEPAAARRGLAYYNFPILDGSMPPLADLVALARRFAEHRQTVYIHCAQGHGRAGMVAASILLAKGLARGADEAIAAAKAARPKLWMKRSQRRMVRRVAEALEREESSQN